MRTLILVTDSPVYAAGFEAVIARDPQLSVEVTLTADQCRRALLRERPELVIVDREVDGATALCRDLSSERPPIPVLVFSADLSPDVVREMIDAGARGLIDRRSDPEYVRMAINELIHGNAILDPRAAAHVLSWIKSPRLVSDATGTLSPREIEVLRYVARGEPDKRIAKHMGLTVNSVKTYLRRAYTKLGCHTRTEAISILSHMGYLPHD